MFDLLQLIWSTLQSLAPWLFLGLAMAGVLHVLLPPDFIARHLGKGNFANVLKAALFGVPMPLCSCGVIPAAIGLKKDGASDGAATSFLISTPQTGLDSIAVCASFLGWPFALFKVLSAFVTGLIGGALVNLGTRQPSAPADSKPRTAASRPPATLAGIYGFAVNDLLYGIWRWILLGVLISAALGHFIPAGTLAGSVWTTGLPGMFVMLAIATPLYVCATGSVPIAASLVAAGMSPGAALVFLMAGPATNAATLGAVYKTFGRRVTAIYLGVIVVGSMVLGLSFNWLLADGGRQAAHLHHTDHSLLSSLAAIGLIILMIRFASRDLAEWNRERRAKAAGLVEPEEPPETLEMQVDGMTCPMCAAHVRQALDCQPHVSRVDIDLASGKVVVQGHTLDFHRLREAIEEAGYSLAPAESPTHSPTGN